MPGTYDPGGCRGSLPRFPFRGRDPAGGNDSSRGGSLCARYPTRLDGDPSRLPHRKALNPPRIHLPPGFEGQVFLSLRSFQSCLLEHCQELLLGSHVDRLSRKLAFAVIDKALGEALDVEQGVDLAVRIKQDRIADLSLLDKRSYLLLSLVGDGEDHESLPGKLTVERIEIRHLLATWGAPSCPEVH